MTVQEYQKDHKRLFGIMDKGFKIVLHREGISDKVIQQATSGEKIQTAKKPSKPKSTTFEKTHPMLSLPGIQKKLDLCTGSERKAVNLLFQKPEKEFTAEDLCNYLGYAQRDAMNPFSWKKLIDLKLIKKTGKSSYQAI